MKKVFRSFVILSTVVTGFTACKKDVLEKENVPAADVAATGQFINPNMAPKLVKKGSDSLIYNQDGSLLSKVLHSATSYTDYTTSSNEITSNYYENNSLRRKVVYKLDNSGKVTQSILTSYEYNIGVTKTFNYIYDGKNQLIKKYNKDAPNERSDFFWGKIGHLSHITWYNANNVETYKVEYSYSLKDDKLKMFSQRTGLDVYLKIFGARPNKLVSSEGVYYPSSPGNNIHETHGFELNRDGYPTKFYRYKTSPWTFIESQTYLYAE